jgi:hypothetical protein
MSRHRGNRESVAVSSSPVVWPVVLASCVLVACGPRPTPVEPDDPDPDVGTLQPSDHRLIAAPRFELDVASLVPDPDHELRWPLSHSSHPKLEPGYDIAAALAQPGVTWIELCEMGAHKRRLASANQDPIVYLAAWCQVLAHNPDAAVGGLEPLRRSSVPAIARAIDIDLANILVSEGDADQAERVLAHHKIDRPELFDILAATFAELGKLDDALVLNARAMESNGYADTRTKCHRLARHVALGETEMLDTLDQISHPDCKALSAGLHCAIYPDTDCGPYFLLSGIDHRMTYVLAAFHVWPATPAAPLAWLRVVDRVKSGIGMPPADDIAVSALETALRASACDSAWVAAVGKIASSLDVRADLASRLRIVTRAPATFCWKPSHAP